MPLYRFLTVILSPLIFLHLLWKSRRLHQPRFLYQRLGLHLNSIPPGCTWFHCASVGETNAVLPLIKELHQRHPNRHFLITTNTVTGAEIIERQQKDWIHHAYLAMDWVNTVKRFIKKVKPITLNIVETELWPNLIDTCKQKNIPVTIINGRLSKKTTQTNRWVRKVYRTTLSRVNHIYVRSDLDRKRYLDLGAKSDRVSVLGNLKYIPPASIDIRPQETTTRDYVVVASTHEGEERKITEVWNKLNRKELLVIAPRHPDRSTNVQRQLESLTGNPAKYLAVRSKKQPVTRDTKIYLLDSVGELTSWYPNALLVVMAGSFIHRGGHNILEPAHFGKAIVVGPHMESFVDENKILIENQAAIQAFSIQELTIILPRLLNDEKERRQLEHNALRAVEPFTHVIADYANVIDQH